MTHGIDPGRIPPPRGLEKEEPELAHEDDIPSDDGTARPSSAADEDRPLRQVERE